MPPAIAPALIGGLAAGAIAGAGKALGGVIKSKREANTALTTSLPARSRVPLSPEQRELAGDLAKSFTPNGGAGLSLPSLGGGGARPVDPSRVQQLAQKIQELQQRTLT